MEVHQRGARGSVNFLFLFEGGAFHQAPVRLCTNSSVEMKLLGT